MSVFESGSNGVVGETENANHMDNAKHDHVDENDADCKLSMQEGLETKNLKGAELRNDQREILDLHQNRTSSFVLMKGPAWVALMTMQNPNDVGRARDNNIINNIVVLKRVVLQAKMRPRTVSSGNKDVKPKHKRAQTKSKLKSQNLNSTFQAKSKDVHNLRSFSAILQGHDFGDNDMYSGHITSGALEAARKFAQCYDMNDNEEPKYHQARDLVLPTDKYVNGKLAPEVKSRKSNKGAQKKGKSKKSALSNDNLKMSSKDYHVNDSLCVVLPINTKGMKKRYCFKKVICIIHFVSTFQS